MADFLVEIIVSVVAGAVIHCICKWLDRDDSNSLGSLTATSKKTLEVTASGVFAVICVTIELPSRYS